MIKTLDNVYINMEDFSGFTIGYPNDSDFTVMAMKELVDNQTATIELGRYPSEKEAKDALKKMIEHQDDIKKAEFFGREEGFYYISNIFTMPKPSKNGKADVKRFMIEFLFLGSTISVNMIDVWTNAIWKSQKLRKGEHIMKKEHSKYQWIIGICCSENDGVKLYKYTGTVKKMKKRLLRLIKEDKKNDKENWESGSETVAELSDESNGEETCFCGYGSYSYYHIDYMAERVSNIEELSNCE